MAIVDQLKWDYISQNLLYIYTSLLGSKLIVLDQFLIY